MNYCEEHVLAERRRVEKENERARVRLYERAQDAEFNTRYGDGGYVGQPRPRTTTRRVSVNGTPFEMIVEKLERSQILFVEGPTGCGKTTKVPFYILNDAMGRGRACNMVVTQPRKIAAISVAKTVAEARGIQLGKLIGYHVGMDKQSGAGTRLTFMTSGVLLQLLVATKSLSQFTHIIVDEVHERDLETDLLLLAIKKLMTKGINKELKIIMMSATFDKGDFEKFFPLWVTELSPSPVIESVLLSSETMYPIQEVYMEQMLAPGTPLPNMDKNKAQIDNICYGLGRKVIEGLDDVEKEGAERGALLVFLPGVPEINAFSSALRASGKSHGWRVLLLHSQMSRAEQLLVFPEPGRNIRKIILATNIAESSITITDIKYVMDFCLTKIDEKDPETDLKRLTMVWASKNQCTQRRGRCGRVSPGICYRMVPKSFYDSLSQGSSPAMTRSSLETVVLRVKMLDMGPPSSILALAINPPAEDDIRSAVSNLKAAGALAEQSTGEYDELDGDLTFAGKVLAQLPVDLGLGRLILFGYAFGVLEEAVIITAGLMVKPPFAYPESKVLEGYMAKLKIGGHSFSDPLTLLKLYSEWECGSHKDEAKWARDNFVRIASLREMKVVRGELLGRLSRYGIISSPSTPSAAQTMMLRFALAGAFYPNYFTWSKRGCGPAERIVKGLHGHDPYTSVILGKLPVGLPSSYEKQIVEQLYWQGTIPHLSFIGEDIVAGFDSRRDQAANIPFAVFRAIKMEKCKNQICVSIPAEVDQNERVAAPEMDHCPAQVRMPGGGQSVRAKVKLAYSPNRFHVILESTKKDAMKIRILLNDASPVLKRMAVERIIPGQFCVIQRGGKHYRARVEVVRPGQKPMVHLLDTGESRPIGYADIFAVGGLLKDKLSSIAAQALRCRLGGIRPAPWTGDAWTGEAMQLCSDMDGQMVQLEGCSVLNDIVVCQLRREGSQVTLNQLLVNKKLAVEQELSRTWMRSFVPKPMVDKKLVDGSQEIIKGPWSPLTMDFVPTCSGHLSKGKKVAIDPYSVNSVMLIQNYERPTSRLLVANAVSARKGGVTIKESSLMPPIAGLDGILVCTFAHRVELRVDKHRYVGVLGGAGADPEGNPITPKSQIELAFDTEIDPDDIHRVNTMRGLMSYILSGTLSRDALPNAIATLRREALALLERERKALKRGSANPPTYKWNVIKQELLLHSPLMKDIQPMFPLINQFFAPNKVLL